MNSRRVSLSELVERIETGVSVRSDGEPAAKGEAAVLKVSSVTSGKFTPAENKRISASDVARACTSPTQGCTLVSRASGSLALVGASAFVEESISDVYLPDKIWQLHPRRSVVDPFWLSLIVASDAVREAVRVAATGSSGMRNISQADFLKIAVPLPHLHYQTEASHILRAVVRAGEQLATLIDAKRTFKRALLNELVTARRRFTEFGAKPIRCIPLGELAAAGAARNRGTLDESHVMGVQKEAGLVPMRDHVRASDLSRYQIVPPNGFAYNPMRLNIGSIARNQSGADCLVSPDYVVFTTEPSALLPAYLDQVRRSDLWTDFVRAAGSGSVRVRIYFRDLAEIQIPLPPLDEQRRIADVLEAADREIALLERLRDAYEAQKRALMHRLLSGDLPLPTPTSRPDFAHA